MGAGVILMAYDKQLNPYLLGLIGDTQHRRKHGATYDLPKGTADAGEPQIDCAIRETFEETGIRVSPADFIAGPFKTSRTFKTFKTWGTQIPDQASFMTPGQPSRHSI